jgi:phosphoribosylglycinamide formyltransferase-1
VLAREHVLYPRVLRWLVEGLLEVDGSAVRQRRGEPQLLT